MHSTTLCTEVQCGQRLRKTVPAGHKTVFVPKRFDFAQFGKQAERCMLLASNLYQRTLHRHQEFPDWVGMPKAYLERLLGRRYYDIVRDVCIDAKLVQYADRYKYAPGHHCKHFRLHRTRWHRNWEPIHLATAGSHRARTADEEYLNSLPTPYRWAAECSLKVEIEDVPLDVIEDVVRANPSHKTCFEQQVELYAQQIAAIRHQMIMPIKDEFGRLHTAVTNLKREFRPYLRLDGERLAGVDIKTSQPLFLGMLVLKRRGGDYAGTREDTAKESTDTSPSRPPLPYVSQCLPYAFPQQEVGGLERWLERIKHGDLYEFLRTKSECSTMTREEFKEKEFFSVLYGPNLTDCSLLQCMRAEFPEIVDFIFEQKGVPRLRELHRQLLECGLSPHGAWRQLTKDHKRKYARLACEMQEMEARFVFGKVVSQLADADIPAITIHDSVLTIGSLSQNVQEVVAHAFQKLGIQAQLHPVHY